MSDVTAAPQGETIERRLATILCADVAGYSRLMGEDEERTVRVFRGHREIFESLVQQHRGRIFNTAGDALLAEFSSAVEAVRCATDIQSALRTRNEHLAPEERMQFRIGLNLGDVIVQGGDLLGDGVNVAARIQAATEPGGICISGSVHDQIQDKLSLEFKPLGEMSYKNIAKPVRTYTIAEGAPLTVPPGRSRTKAIAWIASAAVVAASAWGAWSIMESQREQRAGYEAQLAAQKKAAEDAQRAADDARREAQLQAKAQVAEETLRLAQAERARVESEMKHLDAQKTAAAAAPVASKVPAPAMSGAAQDGLYSGELCNARDGKKQCWPIAVTISNGTIEGSWLSKSGKTSAAKGTVTDGAVRISLEAWTPRGTPLDALLLGRISDGAISAAGNWKDGTRIIGEWRKGTFASAGLTEASVSKVASKVARFDGRYEGQVCNEPRDHPMHCWKLGLIAKDGELAASWKTPKGEPSRAMGAIGPDGVATLTLHSFNPRGDPTQATLSGRLDKGILEMSGTWRGGMPVKASWKRPG